MAKKELIASEVDAAWAAFRDQRDDALRTLDLHWARHIDPSASDEVLLLALHKARYLLVDFDPVLRHESAAWLRAGGHDQLHGFPLLPEGELPTKWS